MKEMCVAAGSGKKEGGKAGLGRVNMHELYVLQSEIPDTNSYNSKADTTTTDTNARTCTERKVVTGFQV